MHVNQDVSGDVVMVIDVLTHIANHTVYAGNHPSCSKVFQLSSLQGQLMPSLLSFKNIVNVKASKHILNTNY
jgi:hypothetical protein